MIYLTDRTIKALKRESRHSESPDFHYRLMGESIASKWFRSRNILCWRTSQTPDEPGRYGIFFKDGTRAMVVLVSKTSFSFDSMAKAKCSLLIGVIMQDAGVGEVVGYRLLPDCRKYGFTKDTIIEMEDLIPIEKLLATIPAVSNFKLSFFLHSLRLFIMGTGAFIDEHAPPF